MARTRRSTEPFEVEITSLLPPGFGVASDPDGRPIRVRGAPPESRQLIQINGRQKGELLARRIAMVRPPPDAVVPRCAVFGLCGGCTLQELSPERQRAHRHQFAMEAVRGPSPVAGVQEHPPTPASPTWSYRNRVELSFGVRQYVSEADHLAGAPVEGRFLGFHAPGRFDRVVDTGRCEIAGEPMNAVIEVARAMLLHPDAPPPWDNRAHVGALRYLQVRHAPSTHELLVALFTTSDPAGTGVEAAAAAFAEALLSLPPDRARVVGVEWVVDDGVADVARGETRRTWGRPWLEEQLGAARLRISRTSFFQTSTIGAARLYDIVGDALGAGGTLLDLYCGAGSIGLYLGGRFDRTFGVEVVPEAVADAAANAAASGVEAEYAAARVEDVPALLADHPRPVRVVVDPPRAGLHPVAARAIAALEADVLVYVACHAPSLGRDRAALEAGGWRLTDLWTVDLFPHTGHVEVVARFTRSAA
jgi:23S rRNA (uracil1939-C5)-methyltransferase